jgi:large subunit ribosomal protein L25
MTDTDLGNTVDLQERKVVRKGLGQLRRDGLIPGVIHDHGKDSVLVVASERTLTKVYHTAGKHHPLELKVGSDKYLALIKEAYFNPVKRRLEHVVFQSINRNEKVQAEIPVKLEGEAPAEKLGLMVLTQLDHVEVEALPKNLPDELTADAAKLAELHDSITVADLSVPVGVVILTEADHPIARVAETPAQISEEAETEGEAAEGGEDESAEGNSAQDSEKTTEGEPTKQ